MLIYRSIVKRELNCFRQKFRAILSRIYSSSGVSYNFLFHPIILNVLNDLLFYYCTYCNSHVLTGHPFPFTLHYFKHMNCISLEVFNITYCILLVYPFCVCAHLVDTIITHPFALVFHEIL